MLRPETCNLVCKEDFFVSRLIIHAHDTVYMQKRVSTTVYMYTSIVTMNLSNHGGEHCLPLICVTVASYFSCVL